MNDFMVLGMAKSGNKADMGGDGGTASAAFEAPNHHSNPTMKRLACESCRDRKIRCDRQQPTCGRCSKMGNPCRYSSRSRPAPSKMDLSRYLLAMNNRLRQAETQLAFQSIIQNPIPTLPLDPGLSAPPSTSQSSPPSPPGTKSTSPSEMMNSGLASALDLGETTMGSHMEGMHQGSMMGWPDLGIDSFNFNLDTMTPLDYAPDTMSPLHMQDPAQHSSFFDPMLLDPSFPASSAPSPNIAIPGLSTSLLQGLYDRYFDLFHPIMPMISRRRFERELSSPSPSLAIQALSSVMAALGSLSIPELHHHVDKCYEQTRTLLDLCERQETGEAFASMNTLQALTLLVMYEFKQPNFARAWMTLGRAVRLAKMMGLDSSSIDGSISGSTTPTRRTSAAGGSAAGPYTAWGARLRLPPARDAAEAEERRRTFWALFVFEAFSTTQTDDEVSTLDRPMHIPLPSPGLSPDEILETKFNMPTMHQLLDSQTTITHVVLSSFAGTIVMVCLYRRCVEHIQAHAAPVAPDVAVSSPAAARGSFWETHYALDKAITHCRAGPLSRHVDPSSTEPRSLAVRINLSAVEISLHEMALVKVQEEKLPAVLAAEAMGKCTAAAADIAKAVQVGRGLTGRRLEQFKTHDRFLIWPMMTAIQICGRMLESGQGQQQQGNDNRTAAADGDELLPSHLRVLSGAMEELIPAEYRTEGWAGGGSGSSTAGSGASPE